MCMVCVYVYVVFVSVCGVGCVYSCMFVSTWCVCVYVFVHMSICVCSFMCAFACVCESCKFLLSWTCGVYCPRPLRFPSLSSHTLQFRGNCDTAHGVIMSHLQGCHSSTWTKRQGSCPFISLCWKIRDTEVCGMF